jgi:hypothetical protein
MNKTSLYIVAILVLIAIAVLFYLKNEKNTLDAHLTTFALEKAEQPDSIVLRQDTLKTYLVLKNNQWVVNGNFPARNRTVEHFFNVLHNLKIEAPATESAKKEVIGLVRENPVHVKLYQKNKKIRDYLVEDSKYKKGATYMMMQQGEEPFLMNLPGHEGDIAPLYHADPSYWRSRIIFSYSGVDLQEVQVLYPEKPAESFILHYTKNDQFYLEQPGSRKKIKNISNERAARYLSYFSDIRYASVIKTSDLLMDSLKHETPFCSFRITDINGKTRKLETYRKMADQLKDQFGQKSKYDLNYLYGIFDGFDEILLIKYTEIDPLFKEIDYFRVE